MLATGTMTMLMNADYVMKQNGGKMRVNIQPQFEKIASWYWEKFDQPTNGTHMSIWDVLERDYSARKVHVGTFGGKYGMSKQMMVEFPDEKSYTMFLLRWK
jgi:hypothetical protein